MACAILNLFYGEKAEMKIILCGGDLPLCYREKLGRYADRVEVMPQNGDIKGSTSSHPDMLGYAYQGELFVAGKYYYKNRDFFDSLGCRITLCSAEYGDYPRDIYFNVFAISGVLFGRTDQTPAQISAKYTKCVKVKQGYAKCSSVPLGDGVVTADSGIARAVSENGGESLLISPGNITLRGYEYGFIGGAVAVPGERVIMPFGDLDTHPDAKRIREFSAYKGYTVDNGKPGAPLCDCGGILVLEV